MFAFGIVEILFALKSWNLFALSNWNLPVRISLSMMVYIFASAILLTRFLA